MRIRERNFFIITMVYVANSRTSYFVTIDFRCFFYPDNVTKSTKTYNNDYYSMNYYEKE